MSIHNKKIAIIGCGNLGLSILNGLLADPRINPKNITVTKRKTSSLEHLASTGIQITSDNRKAAQESELLIVALKPYTILEILGELKDVLDQDRHIMVSLATGISLKQIQSTIDLSLPIFRAMPNTAADVGESLTCIATKSNDESAKDLVTQCFNSIGNSIHINEELMDAATVLGACGIAYVLRFMRGMIQGGIEIGFDAHTATTIVTHTVKGAAQLLIERKQHPEHEIDKVTTPKGCTIAGLNEMEHNGFSSALIKGIVTSYNKIEK
ncbi:pyrroline-5-carboxylate reductase [Nonlabens agnitus]|uniref:Pyrroline-5-carboxylate reductase n=1 Tax=Nonlabens agnitus TaxID=870484 RepID=A0A2S9WTL2_9FLAO|nr:pyrroline-5-carboxylate reductase [Nonlabens agnitus]PRP66790.1 pyrroline-5-carboxylate reductase [Nonlabens agnitus]